MNSKRKPNQADPPSKSDMMVALQRSGYLLESVIVRHLNEAGFFVEPNQSLLNERTGLSQEIDILAEFYNYNPEHEHVCVKTNFVIEVINNLYPFVLTTPRTWSPNSPTEDYLRYWTTPGENHENHFLGKLDIFDIKGVDKRRLFSQYCAFTRKKSNDDLMACHPEDVHSSLQKMVEYSLDSIERWFDYASDEYWRLFFWQPVLVLRNDLFAVSETQDKEPELVSIESAQLEHNFHYRSKPETMIVDVVTEPHLLKLLQTHVREDEICEKRIFAMKTGSSD